MHHSLFLSLSLFMSTSQISSQFARYKSDCFAIPQVPGLNPAPAKSFSHHLKLVGYLFDLYKTYIYLNSLELISSPVSNLHFL